MVGAVPLHTCISGVVASVWHPFGTRVAFAWQPRGFRVAFVWHACGIRVAFAWHSCGIRVACGWHPVDAAARATAKGRPRLLPTVQTLLYTVYRPRPLVSGHQQRMCPELITRQ